MLDPHDRQLLLDSLRPPVGFRLDRAIGTTYSLDLIALLAAPLAFAFFAGGEGDDGRETDPLALLRALRTQAERCIIFCQGGQIQIPPRNQRLLAYLEGSVVQAMAPGGGAFHPKVWVLRFANGEDVRYRFLCLSRNLTFDRSWDTVLRLDGTLVDRATAIAGNRPLADFVAALPDLARPTLVDARRDIVLQVAEDLRRVRFEPIEDFELRFWPLGIDGHRAWPFAERIDRMLVISPFLDDGLLASLGAQGRNHVLVSRIEQLQALDPSSRKLFSRLYYMDDALDDDAGPEPSETRPAEASPETASSESGPDSSLVGLHAKVYVTDAGRTSSIWVGSANATSAAFQRNVELLVELVGTRSKLGIDATLGSADDRTSLLSLLRELPHSPEVKPPDDVARRLESRLLAARHRLVEAGLGAIVAPLAGESRFDLRLRCAGSAGLTLEGISRASFWPITLADAHAMLLPLPLPAETIWPMPVSFEALTTFFAFELVAVEDGREAAARFVLSLPLEGAPADRQERILASFLTDRAAVLRFLLLLLAAEGEEAAILAAIGGTATATAASRALDGRQLLESLLKTLDGSPGRIDEVQALVEDLRRTGAGDRLPEGFDVIWPAIWQARQELDR